MAGLRFEPPRCGYTIEGSRVRSDGTVLGKISGTKVSGIMDISPFSTPFSVACDLLGLGRQDVSDKPAVKTGKVLEGPIIEYLSKAYPEIGTFIPAEDMYEERTGPHQSWKPDFDDDVFSGHIDGAVMKDSGETYILEVKTSANLASWMDGVPEYYFWQVALYNHFLAHQDKAYVALGVVDDSTHRDPYAWQPNSSNVVLMEVDIDQQEVADKLDEVREWYRELSMTYTTPEYDPYSMVDVPLYTHLANIATDEDTMRALIDEMASIDRRISEQKKDVDWLEQQNDMLRAKLKDYLTGHDMPEMPSASGDYRAVLGTQTRRRVSEAKLREAGIDPEPFIEVTTSNTFMIKKNHTEE